MDCMDGGGVFGLGKPCGGAITQPGTIGPPGIDVTNFGAAGDAQVTSGCSSMNSTTLNCGFVFALTDVGKSIEIPTGAVSLATYLGTIIAVNNVSNGFYKTVTLSPPLSQAVNNVTVTWGTDNSAAFSAAANTCPAAKGSPFSGFSQKGCVLYVPSAGTNGTGDYMFGSGVVLSTQTSFQIVAMGNSGKFQATTQAGVRFLTAMPITILTVGQFSSTNNNLAGFQMYDVTFKDTSQKGAALGGLDMIQVSEASVAYCDFEDFNGSITDPANSAATLLSYGMKSDPGTQGGFSNNIVLLHDKGEDNAVFYDGSNPNQDGPIVFGGDIFPTDNLQNGPCYGIVSGGTLRLYGTHFDVGSDTATPPHPCYGLRMLSAGIVSAKFESTAPAPVVVGKGVLLQGGNTGANPVNTNNAVRNGNGTAVTLTFAGTPSPAFQPGQLIVVACNSDTSFNGSFVVGSVVGNTLTYDQVGTANQQNTNGSCTGTGLTASHARVEATAANVAALVTIGQGAANNQLELMPAGGITSVYEDQGGVTNNIEMVGGQPGGVISGPGTQALGGFSLFGANGGATTDGSGAAGGNAGPMSITLGAGGASTTGTGGNGGVITFNIGAGGAGTTSGKNGEVIFQAPSSPNSNLFSVQNSSAADQVYVDGSFALNAGAGRFNVSSGGAITKYNNIATFTTGSQGLPIEVNLSSTLNSSSSVTTPVNLVGATAGSTTMYRVSFYLFEASAGVGCSSNATVSVTINWTDPSLGRNLTPPSVSMGNTNSAASKSEGVLTLVAGPATSITYTTAYTPGSGCATAPTYSVYLLVEQM